MTARADLTGRKFGRLTVVAFSHSKNSRAYWSCLCDCGGKSTVGSSNLRETAKSPVRSCGCLKIEKCIVMGRGTRRHGDAVKRTAEYKTWRNIRSRCYNPRNASFEWYGARGISVCNRWRESFEAFLADMGRKPSARHSIDRINPDGNYEPPNCRWATTLEQRHNRRN